MQLLEVQSDAVLDHEVLELDIEEPQHATDERRRGEVRSEDTASAKTECSRLILQLEEETSPQRRAQAAGAIVHTGFDLTTDEDGTLFDLSDVFRVLLDLRHDLLERRVVFLDLGAEVIDAVAVLFANLVELAQVTHRRPLPGEFHLIGLRLRRSRRRLCGRLRLLLGRGGCGERLADLLLGVVAVTFAASPHATVPTGHLVLLGLGLGARIEIPTDLLRSLLLGLLGLGHLDGSARAQLVGEIADDLLRGLGLRALELEARRLHGLGRFGELLQLLLVLFAVGLFGLDLREIGFRLLDSNLGRGNLGRRIVLGTGGERARGPNGQQRRENHELLHLPLLGNWPTIARWHC